MKLMGKEQQKHDYLYWEFSEELVDKQLEWNNGKQ